MMMRKLLLSGFLFAFVFTQIDAQDYNCLGLTAIDSVQQLYIADGEQLFVRTIDQDKEVKTNVIRLPQDQILPITSALLSIYNNDELPHWEEIIQRYQIHAKDEVSSRQFQLIADTSFLWQLETQIDPTSFASGDSELDRLLHELQISLVEPAQYIQLHGDSEIYLQLDMTSRFPLNIQALIKRLQIIEGVVSIRPLLTEMTGESTTDIELEIFDDFMEFTFRYSWNCTDGGDCRNDHFWVYRVYPNCDTEFIKEKGDVLPIREIPGFLSTGLYPNPTVDQVSVQLVGPTDKDIRVILFSSLGQILESRSIRTQSGFIELEFSLKDQPVGLYFLGLISEGKVLTEKILKK